MRSHKRTRRKPTNDPSSGSQTSVNVTQHSSPRGSLTPIDDTSKNRKTGRGVLRRQNESGQRGPGRISPRLTIGALPDKVLLDIFDFYREEHDRFWSWPWITLVHVCRSWRYVVFGSPLRLDLCLTCAPNTPVRETLDVWPQLPIEIILDCPDDVPVDNIIIAILEHRDRINKIWIAFPTSSQLEQLVPIMQEPFPALTSLALWTDKTSPALPDMFLGRSAPRLRRLQLHHIPFPGLRRLLLSAPDLFSLRLMKIPHANYNSPEAMVTSISPLTRLRSLTIRFEPPASHSDRRGRRAPPITRVILPALEVLDFRGVSEYLEDLVARIDAPRLRSLRISFFNQVIFDIRQLPYFIDHTGILRSSNHAVLTFFTDHVDINLPLSKETDSSNELNLGVYCRAVDWQVLSMAQICNQLSLLLSIVEQLDIQVDPDRESTWQVDMEDTQWLELFRPFTAVRTLQITLELQPLILLALQELTGERATEVLPALDRLYLEEYQPSGSEQQAIKPFLAARQYSDHPVAVHLWDRSDESAWESDWE